MGIVVVHFFQWLSVSADAEGGWHLKGGKEWAPRNTPRRKWPRAGKAGLRENSRTFALPALSAEVVSVPGFVFSKDGTVADEGGERGFPPATLILHQFLALVPHLINEDMSSFRTSIEYESSEILPSDLVPRSPGNGYEGGRVEERAIGKMKTENGRWGGWGGAFGSESFTEAPSPGPRAKELLGKKKELHRSGEIPWSSLQENFKPQDGQILISEKKRSLKADGRQGTH